MRKSFYLSGLLAICFVLFSGAASAITDPTIVTQPVNDTVYIGGGAHFNIKALTNSTDVLGFEWQVSADAGASWADVTGAAVTNTDTTSLISFTGSWAMNTYQYRCIVSTSTDADTSDAATLVVSAGLPPVINPNLVNDTVFAGFPETFTIAATDTPSFEDMSIEWQLSTDGGSSWTPVASDFGVTTSSFYIPVTSLSMNGDMYRAIVSNTAGADTTMATLTVLAGHPPVITANPHDTAVCETASPYFSVKANDTPGTLAIHYTWFSSADGGMSWDTVHNVAGQFAGATTDTLKLSPAALHFRSGYMYYAAVGNDSGLVFSNPALLTVDSNNAGTITGINEICKGTSTTLTSTVLGGTWSVTHPAVDTVDSVSGSVYAVGPGVDTIIYTVHNLCGTLTAHFTEKVDTILNSLPIEGPNATCLGHFIDLTNPNGGGTWSASSSVLTVDSTGRVVALTQGSAAVTYTLSNVCNTTETTYFVRVDTTLAAGTVSGDSILCAGSWIHFTATAPGEGIWLSSNSAVATTDFDGNVTGVSNGVAVISYFFSNACGVSAATHTVTVSAVASVITGLDSVGIGFTRTFLDSVAGGTWSISDTNIARIDTATGMVTGRDTGSVIVRYTVTNTCGTSTSSLLIHVGATYAGRILGADSVCVGNTVTLSDTVAGGVWSTLSDTVATVDASGLVTGIAGGVSHITYTVTNGFGPKSIITSVFVKHAGVDSLHIPNIFSLGGSYTFYGFPAGGTWHASNPAVGDFIGSPGFFVITHAGIDVITYTVTNSCGTADTSFIIDIPFPAGVNPVAGNVSVLNVYPNPSEGNFSINVASSVNEEVSVTVSNIVGEKVKELSIRTNEASELKLDQPDGVYFITANTSTGKYSAKITITK